MKTIGQSVVLANQGDDRGNALALPRRWSPLTVAFAVACIGAACVSEAALTSKSYVQEGLIGHLDAIDNAGTGTHDASAAVWKDLAGDIGDFTVNASCASFTGGNALKKNGSGYMAKNPKRSPSIRTIEAALSDIPTTGWVMAFFAGGQYLPLSDVKFAGYRTYFIDYNKYGVSTTVKPAQFTAAATYRLATDGLRVYQNGDVVTGNSHLNTWEDSMNNDLSIGGRTSAGGGELAITGYSIHAIRLYNRPLTADEVAANALVDGVRYRGAAEADLDAALKPHGFRIAADGTLHRRAVLKCCSASGHGDGTFTVYGQLRGHQEGTTDVTLLWGTSADELVNEVAVKTIDVSARPPTFAKDVQATAGGTVYWKLRAVNTQGEGSYTSETEVATVRCAFLPETLETPVTTIDIEQGKTVNLVDWLANAGVAAPSGAGSIVKTGKGTLLITNDVLSAFSGNVYICSGGRIQVECPSPFGTSTEGAVRIEKGAQLYHHWPSRALSAPTFGSKPVYIEGSGTDGNGAILCRSDYSSNSQVIGEPSVVHLAGNARIGYTGKQTYMKGNVYLHGFTWELKPAADWDYPDQTLYDETEAGHIYMPSSALFNSLAFNFGDPDNFFTIASGYLRANGYTMKRPLTLVLKTNTGIYTGRSTSSWNGPVYLESGDHVVSRQFEDYPSWKFTGIVSGPGRIGKVGSGTNLSGIRLDNAYNDFTGGLYLHTGEYVNIGVNGSLPKDGGAFTSVSSRVDFNTAGPYALPEAVFSATGLVQSVSGVARATGTWKKVTKEKAGTVVYNSLVGSPDLVVTGGTIRFPADEQPVFTNVQVRTGASVTFGDGFVGSWTVPNLKSGGGTIDGAVAADGFVVDAAAADETLLVSGALTFAAESQVEVPLDLPHRGHPAYTLVTAASITGLPLSANEAWYTQLVSNDNGTKSIRLVYGRGLRVIVQ